MKKFMAILMVCVMALVLCSCGSKYVGEWEGTFMGAKMEINIDSDGTGTLSAMGQSESFTWEEEDGKLIMDHDGDKEEAVLEDDKLVIEDSGIKLEFEKVD